MYSRTQKYSAILSLVLIMTIILMFVVSSIPTTVNAYSDGAYSGREDATRIEDFGGSMSAMYKFRAWSVCKGIGMSDIQASAVLACINCESGFRSEIVEGENPLISNCPPGDEDKYADYPYLGDTESEADTYISYYSTYIDTDPDFRTECTNAIMRTYGIPEETITEMNKPLEDRDSTKIDSSVVLDGEETTLSLTTYYDSHGQGNTGCGLIGFTGGSLTQLFAWSRDTSYRWFEFDNQMAYLISYSTNGYALCKGKSIDTWIKETEDMTLEECVESYAKTYVNGAMPDGQLEKRKEAAIPIYDEMNGLMWDFIYAQKIAAMADVDAIDTRDGIEDESIIHSYGSAVIYYPWNKGFIVDKVASAQLKEKNKEVFTGYIDSLNGETDTSSTYSLFELYGEDVNWCRYFGEETYVPELVDHIYSGVTQHKTDELISHPIETINYDAYNYLSCQVYQGRPQVLSKDDLSDGNKDPRVSTFKTSLFDGYFYVVGSWKLAVVKFCIAIVSVLMGHEIQDKTTELFTWLESTDIWEGFKGPILVIAGIGMVFFIISLMIKSVKYAKGSGSAREAMNRFLAGLLAITFLFTALAFPAGFNNIFNKVVNVVDNLFDAALADTLENDEVICVTDDSMAVHAVLWRKAVFNPWCRGQFDNREYEELYTQYATLSDGQSMMPQDHEEIDTEDATGRAFFDSATNTGDVFAYVGGGKEIRNWAAYLYSCGTPYHIDSTIDADTVVEISLEDGVTFPHWSTKTTAYNKNIYADTFRVIDAQMNISPQYFASGSVQYNYTNAHRLYHHFGMQSAVAIFNGLLILFMFPVIIKKIKSFMLLLATMIKLIVFCIADLFKEGSGLKPFLDSVKAHFVDYFTACLKLNLMITLYYIFVDKGFIELVLYMVCCLVILGFTWQKARDGINDAKYKFKRYAHRL